MSFQNKGTYRKQLCLTRTKKMMKNSNSHWNKENDATL